MYFDALTLACVADELRATILRGRVQQVVLPDKRSVGLEIYARGERHYLLASAHTDLGRVSLAAEKLRRGVEKQTGLLQLLRKYVRGANLSDIRQPPFERILHLEFDHPEWGCTELVAEIMGRHSNIILVEPGNRVLDAVKRVGPQMSSVRPILPNQPYAPPPPQDKLPPPELTEYRLREILQAGRDKDQVWRLLVRGLQGMSPLLAREVSFRALGRPRAKVAQVEQIQPLLAAIKDLLSPLDDGQWQPTLALEDGEPVVYAPYPLTHRDERRPMPSISQAIEVYTAAAANAASFGYKPGSPYAAAKRPLRQAIAKARDRLEHREKSLRRSLKQVDDADRLRQWGEWTLGYAHTVERGQTELVAEIAPGETERIPLDPALSAVENAQAFFDRYRKAQRAEKEIPVQIRRTQLALQDLEQLETDLALAESRPEIEEVRTALIEANHLRPSRKKRPKMPRSKPLSLTSPDGLPMLVGRNSRQNDEVTFRRANSDDWWFHARGVPGAHVIVRGEQGELPPNTVQRAAELAAHFSQLRDERDVQVDYTQRRHVRRIPGAAPGLVTYRQEQTIRVAPRGPEEN